MITVIVFASLATVALGTAGTRVYRRRRSAARHDGCANARRVTLEVVADAESLADLARRAEANAEPAPWEAMSDRQESLLRSIRHLDDRNSGAGFQRAVTEANRAAARFSIELRRRRALSVPNSIAPIRQASAPRLDHLSEELLLASRFMSIVAHVECVAGHGRCAQS